MNKIKDYNLVCTNINNRCHLTCVECTGSIVSVFLGKADFLCADPRNVLLFKFHSFNGISHNVNKTFCGYDVTPCIL